MRRLSKGIAVLCGTVAFLVFGVAAESRASVRSGGIGDHEHGSHSSQQEEGPQRGFDVIDVLVWGGFSQEDHRGGDRSNLEFTHGPLFVIGDGNSEHESGNSWDAEEGCNCSLLRFLDQGRFLLTLGSFRFEVENAVRENHHGRKWGHHGHFAGHFIGHWISGDGVYEDCDDDPPAVPEPSTALLIGLGLLGIGFGRGRARRG